MNISDIGKHTIVLDDDPVMSAIIEDSIDIKSFSIPSLTKLHEQFGKYNPVAVLVDVYLEDGENGLDGIIDIKESWPEAVVIVMTADHDAKIIGKALSLGADDFIRKPIEPDELRARLAARIEAAAVMNSKTILKFADCSFNTQTKVLQSAKGKTQLSIRESSILEKLINAGGMVVSKDELRAAAWGEFKVSNNALDRKLHEVRKIVGSLTDEVELKAKYGGGLFLRDKNFEEKKHLAGDYEILGGSPSSTQP
jgi:DNA-binding response OmpR family regulator